jgi:EAL domain-containing protein (putative c-di-GMP-specific phosphodiesterase class I)
MYQAKDRGKGRFELFHPKMREAVLKRHGLREELQKAIEGREFVVDYQPIVALDTGEIVAAEALVRWEHQARGLLPPSEFIPLAEETGQIVAVGQFVLEEACRRARAWQEGRDAVHPIDIHVNMSGIEFQNAEVVEEVTSTLERTGLSPERLVLEITESVVQDDTTALTLHRLRSAGIRIAMDDFGTGYSSLSYLRSLSLDILKIAKPFVDGIAEGRQENSFVRMIIELARTLDLQVIAEGVESGDQLDVLRDLGCDFGQGFYLTGTLPGDSGEPAIPLSAAS